MASVCLTSVNFYGLEWLTGAMAAAFDCIVGSKGLEMLIGLSIAWVKWLLTSAAGVCMTCSVTCLNGC